MRFACHTCHTRYSLPDEKAHGRLLKVRCKKCGTVLFLKPPLDTTTTPVLVTASPTTEAGAQEADIGGAKRSREAGQPPGPTSIENSEWYAIVAGVQVGPIAFSALFQRMTLGQIDARTYVWRDTMAAWKRVEAIPELTRLLPKEAPEPAARRTRTIELPAVPSVSGPAVTQPTKRSRSSATRTPSTVSGARVVGARPTAAEVGDRTATVLEGPPAGEETEDATPAVEEIWHSSPIAATAGTDPLAKVPDAHSFSAVSRADSTQFVIARGLPDQSPWPRALALIGLTVVFLASMVFLGSRLGVRVPLIHRTPKTPPTYFSEEGSDDPKLKRALAGHRPAHPQATPGGGPGHPGGGTAGHESDVPSIQVSKEERHVETLAERDKAQLQKIYAGGVKEPQIKAHDTPVVDSPSAPLTAQQVAATVAHYQNGYNACVDRELKRNPNFRGGKIRIVTTIASSGLVRQAQIQSDDQSLARLVSGSQLGACLTEHTRRMVFPNFAGDPFDAEIPLVLGASF